MVRRRVGAGGRIVTVRAAVTRIAKRTETATGTETGQSDPVPVSLSVR
jgi:hypothetical protein